ncbi:VOC family protein [Xylanimonas protaetiae]|uniref:VOC family protein n=1 Tax=Xylanimonas protaetiae TaxID=2509457 RepID=A0A4V0YFX3_9MICO|nr:VOC family protein [Xylanimonas protaetiae]QAY69211.1 VOC family protein [Xylanimonas protaetiae]
MANLVVHFEIYGTEPERLVDFYSALFGWTIDRYGEMEYWGVQTGEGSVQSSAGTPGLGINGGIAKRDGPAPTPGGPVAGANIVVAVDDVDATFSKGLELGGTDAMAPTDMEGVGRLAYLHDPAGNLFGFLSPVLSDGTSAM